MERPLEHASSRFAVGAEYDSLSDLKHVYKHAAILDIYEFIPVRVTTSRYTLKYKSDECPWYLFATPVVKNTTIWRIKKSIQTHTCHGINYLGHKNLDEDFISIEILPKLRNDTSYTPKAIQIDIKAQFGIEIDYQKAYRSKERALKHINGSHEDAYKYLPKYCEEIKRSNPGTTAVLEINEETNQFKRMFICFAANSMGFGIAALFLGLMELI